MGTGPEGVERRSCVGAGDAFECAGAQGSQFQAHSGRGEKVICIIGNQDVRRL